MKVGCQIPWGMVNVTGMPLCDNSTIFKKYDKYMDEVLVKQRDDLIRTTKCFLPCTFMEYKVSATCKTCLKLLLLDLSFSLCAAGRGSNSYLQRSKNRSKTFSQ